MPTQQRYNYVRARVALHLQRRRMAKGWSHGELARRAGLSVSTIRRAERGEQNLKIDNVTVLANALGVETEDLFEPTDMH